MPEVVAAEKFPEQPDATVEPPKEVEQPDAAPAKAPKAGPYSREVLMSEAKISKHYWQAFGDDGGFAIVKAAAPDVVVQANKKTQSLIITGRKRDVERAAKVLVKTWVEGFAEFRVWRRTDEAYKALPSQDTHWATSERYAREPAWLRSYAHAQGVL